MPGICPSLTDELMPHLQHSRMPGWSLGELAGNTAFWIIIRAPPKCRSAGFSARGLGPPPNWQFGSYNLAIRVDGHEPGLFGLPPTKKITVQAVTRLASSTDLCSPLGLTRLVAIRYIFGLTVQARTRLPPIQITHTDYPRWSGSHRIAIWYISGLAIRTCTHAAPVGLSPDCHSLDVWSRCSGAHPIATHTCSPVRLSPDCHSVNIWSRRCHPYRLCSPARPNIY